MLVLLVSICRGRNNVFPADSICHCFVGFQFKEVSYKLVVDGGIIQLFHSELCYVNESRKLQWLFPLWSPALSLFHRVLHDCFVREGHERWWKVKNSAPVSTVVVQDSEEHCLVTTVLKCIHLVPPSIHAFLFKGKVVHYDTAVYAIQLAGSTHQNSNMS